MEKKLSVRFNIFIIISLLTSIGCQQQADPISQIPPEKRPAPQSIEQLGVVIQGSSQEQVAAFVEENHSLSYRVINKKHQLFEVYGASVDELRARFKTGVSQNQWLDPIPVITQVSTSQNTLNEETLNFRTCDTRQMQRPRASLKVTGFDNHEVQTFELGESVQVQATAEAHADHPSELTSGFILRHPQGANQTEELIMGTELSVQFEAMGIYEILFITQDDRDSCGRTSLRLSVTGNLPYEGPKYHLASLSSPDELKEFVHLSEVSAFESWGTSTGEGITVAVIDTGVHYNHPDLRNNIAINLNEIPDNQIDDDENGFVDDYVGYDFSYQDPFPFDDMGHGTHVAGLAASGRFGTAPNAKILPIKALGVGGGGDFASIAGAIFYAVDREVEIINLSLGGPGASHPALIRALNYAEEKGVLVISAAGNGDMMTGRGLNTDLVPFFPSSYPHRNLVSVTSHAGHLGLAPYANMGIESVHVAAPGGFGPDNHLLSSFMFTPSGMNFARMSGTSMAAPVVAGIAAQILSANPNLRPEEVRRILIESGEPNARLKNLILSGGKIKANLAVQQAVLIDSK